MKIKVDEQELVLEFAHSLNVSACLIWVEIEGILNFLSDGYAFCSPKDKFSRRFGRKLAFSRAIAKYPRTDRSKLWDAYFAVLPKDRTKVMPKGKPGTGPFATCGDCKEKLKKARRKWRKGRVRQQEQTAKSGTVPTGCR